MLEPPVTSKSACRRFYFARFSLLNILGEGSELFSVNAVTGTIQISCDATAAAMLDRESQDQYDLSLQVTDSAGHKVVYKDFLF